VLFCTYIFQNHSRLFKKYTHISHKINLANILKLFNTLHITTENSYKSKNISQSNVFGPEIFLYFIPTTTS